MNNIKKILSILLLTIAFNSFCQLDFSYKAEKMSDSINSKYSECAPVFSPDGTKMYFVRVNHPENRFGEKGSQDIWVSEKVNNTWNQATRLPNEVNLARYNAIYSVLPKGELLINGIYTKKGKFLKRGLSTVKPNVKGYFAPKALKIKSYARKSNGKVASLHMDPSGKHIFISFSKKNKSTANSLYVSSNKNGKWKKPKKIKGLNSIRSEESPFLSQDASTLYFSSNISGIKEGFDIYSAKISKAKEFRKWSYPTKLNGDFNSPDNDCFFVLDAKEEFAYFSSNRGSGSNSEIYRLKVKDIRDFVLVKGYVVNMENNKKIPENTPFSIKIETKGTIGQPKTITPNNLRIAKDSSLFEFELPFGSEYSMVAVVDGYEEAPVAINLLKISKYQVFDNDAKVKAVPVMTLTGKIEFENNTNPNFDSTQIYANGVLVENAIISTNGSYSLQLPTGKLYNIEAKKAKHIAYPVNVDVTKELTRTTRTANLKLEEILETYSILNSKVLNKKDSSIIDPSKYTVFVNGAKAPSEILSFTKEGFELRLEKGKRFFVMVNSQEYIESHDSVDFRNVKLKEKIDKTFFLTPLEVGATVKIKHIYFDLGKSKLKEVSFTELNLLVQLLKDHDHLKIEISGHTDNKGNVYLNQKLSGERALAVKNYLINVGKIDPVRLESKGYGFSKPVAKNDTESNRAQNRRVEFMILANE